MGKGKICQYVLAALIHQLRHPLESSPEEGEPERTGLTGTHIERQHFPLATGVHPNGDHQGHADHPAILSHLGERGIKPDVRVGPLEPSIPKALYLGIKTLTEPGDLALADPGHPECLYEIVYASGADAMHIRFLHNSNQCLFRSLAWLQQAREVAVVPHPRNREFDRPHPRVPRALPAPVAMPSPLTSPFISLSTQVLAHLQFHDLLGEQAHAVAQKLRVL